LEESLAKISNVPNGQTIIVAFVQVFGALNIVLPPTLVIAQVDGSMCTLLMDHFAIMRSHQGDINLF